MQAAKKIGLAKPLVIRLQGTNVREAKAIIEASGYRYSFRRRQVCESGN